MDTTESPTLVYFDTNVFDNLVKKTGGIKPEDESLLRDAVSSRSLIVLASHVTIRETIAALSSRPEIARDQLRLMVELADWDRFVRVHSTILEADIRHFAFTGEQANPSFEGNQNAANIRATLEHVIEDPTLTSTLANVLNEDRQQKQEFLDGVQNARAETEQKLEEFRKQGNVPIFEEWFKDSAEQWVLPFIKSYGVAEECQRGGLDKLLKIPSVWGTVGVGMSFVYRTAVDRKAPRSSARRDLQHVTCAAAAADIFVTQDDELNLLISRVPLSRIRVMNLLQLRRRLRRLRLFRLRRAGRCANGDGAAVLQGIHVRFRGGLPRI